MEEPCFLLACQRNVTASSVRGQTGECSLQLSITPGAGRDAHRELSLRSFIYLFLFSPLYVSSVSRALPHFVAFPTSLSFVTFLSYRTCQHLSSVRGFYANTWIFSNNFSSSLFRCCTLSASISDLIQSLAGAQRVLPAHIRAQTPPPIHLHAHT